jgi:hypothetical protein
MLLGQFQSMRIREAPDRLRLSEIEFGVFSQFSEDGIIEYLISHMEIAENVFVEFGVEDYVESNTRFLLYNRNWRGLIIDGNNNYLSQIKNDPLFWRYDVTAVNSFITAENINQILQNAGVSGDIGLLSVDIDGNDYWVWKAIDVISPRIVICECNGIWGGEHAVTIPYSPDFQRLNYHYSGLCYGASLQALCALAEEKGYCFVGATRVGNNVFFVRNDCASRLQPLTPEQGYTESKIRESRDLAGKRTLLRSDERLTAIADCEIYDIARQKRVKVRELYQLER